MARRRAKQPCCKAEVPAEGAEPFPSVVRTSLLLALLSFAHAQTPLPFMGDTDFRRSLIIGSAFDESPSVVEVSAK